MQKHHTRNDLRGIKNIEIEIMIENPFVLRGYVSEEYFCDREKETADLIAEIKNGNNVTLIAPRRIGKTGLVQHVYAQDPIKQNYYTFLIDIYATKNLADFIQELGRGILQSLKPKGTKVVEYFLNCLHSLRSSVSFDMNGNPSWSVDLGDITSPTTTLHEIFHYLETADKPCIVAIDEFQTISNYKEENVEALLRTYIQHSHNTNFIFAGSQRDMMTEMFLSHARPFYQSTSIKTLRPIDKEIYADFATRLFGKKTIKRDIIYQIYDRFDGITWYLQRMLNKIYAITDTTVDADEQTLSQALNSIIDESAFAYEALLFQLPARQKELLLAICKAGKARSITSAAFTKKHHLPSASFVQGAIKGLLDKDFVTETDGTYELYDKFFGEWLKKEM